jgi:hypothetical protein
MMPTQEKIKEAEFCFTMSTHPLYNNPVFIFGRILLSAYRAEKDRADKNSEAVDGVVSQWKLTEAHAKLVELHYAQLVSFAVVDNPEEYLGDMLARHEAERKALASQAVDKASEPRNNADASGNLPAREGQL